MNHSYVSRVQESLGLDSSHKQPFHRFTLLTRQIKQSTLTQWCIFHSRLKSAFYKCTKQQDEQ